MLMRLDVILGMTDVRGSADFQQMNLLNGRAEHAADSCLQHMLATQWMSPANGLWPDNVVEEFDLLTLNMMMIFLHHLQWRHHQPLLQLKIQGCLPSEHPTEILMHLPRKTHHRRRRLSCRVIECWIG